MSGVEINKGPGLRPHWIANPDQDVLGPMIDLMFPEGNDGRIPTAMVTGSKGKTTTCLMLARILEAAGHITGLATTDGVVIDGDWLLKKDVAGAGGAAMVLTDPDVTAAVLETARGGLLKDGIYLDRCDVAAFLNVRPEQIGIDGVETLEQMAEVKRKVVDTAEKPVVLNLDDPLTAALVPEFPPEHVIGFSMQEKAPAVAELTARCGAAVVLRLGNAEEEIIFLSPGAETSVISAMQIPVTMNGRHRGNVANALAATGLAQGMGIGWAEIAAGLRACEMTRTGKPGRMIFLPGLPFEVLIEFSANAPAVEAIVAALGEKPDGQRRLCVFAAPGNRPAWDYQARTAALARGFDAFICHEIPEKRAGREPGGIAEDLRCGLDAAGVSADSATVALELDDALSIARDSIRPGDFLAILGMPTTSLLAAFRGVFGSAAGGDDADR